MQDGSQRARYVEIKEVLAQVLPKGGAVLDVGCGTGNGLRLWREVGVGSFEGIDISKTAIDAARAAYADVPDTRFTTASIGSYDAQGRTFDVVLATEVLYLVSDPEADVKKMRALTKPGGHLVISMSDTSYSDKVWAMLGQKLPAPVVRRAIKSAEGNKWTVAAIKVD